MSNAAQLADQHHKTATRLHGSGHLEEAEKHYLAALQITPNNADILHALGLIYLRTRRSKDAVETLAKAAQLSRSDAVLHSNLGMALLRLSRHKEAIKVLERAAELKPDYAVAHFNLAMAFKELGRTEEAISAFEKTLALTPDHYSAMYNLAEILKAIDRSDEALAIFKKLVDLNPDMALARNNYGLMLSMTKHPREAIAQYERAIELDPGLLIAFTNMSHTLNLLGRAEDALEVLDRALAIDPKAVPALMGRGFTLRAMGQSEEGRKIFERAVELAPTYVDAHRFLAETKTFSEGDPQLAAMEELAQSDEVLPGDAATLQFIISKAYSDLGKPEKAFKHLDRANKTWRKLISYDEEKEFESFREMERIFTPELIAEKRGMGNPSEIPIFIVGMPRSGTTLVEQILASHPDVYGGDELGDLGDSLAGGYEPKPLPFDVSALSASELRRMGTTYLDRVMPRAPTARRITDKKPDNFRFAGLAHLALPNARVINLQRDPIDNCFSCYQLASPAIFKFTYDLAELGRFYRAYENLMAHWRKVLPASSYLDVQYEDLVDNVEDGARRIIAFCGLDWDDRCLEFHKTKRSVRTASVMQVRQPIYRSSVGRWRPYKDHLRPLIEALGLDFETA